MNDIMTENKLMTTKEVADVLGVTSKAVREAAKRCMPLKVFETGKQTYWTEPEVTVLIEHMKNNSYSSAKTKESNLYHCGTSLTPMYKFSQATEKINSYIDEAFEVLPPEETRAVINGMYSCILQGMNRAFDQYEAEHQKALKLLELKNNLEIELNESKEWYSIKRMEFLNPGKTFNWRELKKSSNDMGCEIKEVFDQNYGSVNAYHISVWEEVYFDTLNYGD